PCRGDAGRARGRAGAGVSPPAEGSATSGTSRSSIPVHTRRVRALITSTMRDFTRFESIRQWLESRILADSPLLEQRFDEFLRVERRKVVGLFTRADEAYRYPEL